jgi:hypothetical protein
VVFGCEIVTAQFQCSVIMIHLEQLSSTREERT